MQAPVQIQPDCLPPWYELRGDTLNPLSGK
jgi:hypothetical protein